MLGGAIGSTGSYTPPRSPGKYKGAGVGPSPAYSYSCAVAEVTVDQETGIICGRVDGNIEQVANRTRLVARSQRKMRNLRAR